MYSREEASRLKEQFWIAFGKYMKPVPSAEGLHINWINYKTGVKHISFKMDADRQKVSIAIEITHQDADLRTFYFEKFEGVRALLEEACGEEWDWKPVAQNEFEMPLAQISKKLSGVNIYNAEQRPTLISFLKPRIIALDHFWTDVKPLFDH